MQHNMSPMIGMRRFPSPHRGKASEGAPAFAFGLPGGPKIVSVTAQLVLDTIAFGATPAVSISAPRVHTDGSEPILVSTHMPTDVVAHMERSGHTIRREEHMGGPVNVLAVDSTTGKIDVASGETIGAVAGF